MPKAWVEKQGNLVWYKQHNKASIICSFPYSRPSPVLILVSMDKLVLLVIQGGHFAALEQPELIIQDLDEFVQQVWPVK
jgi:hypothetical protein